MASQQEQDKYFFPYGKSPLSLLRPIGNVVGLLVDSPGNFFKSAVEHWSRVEITAWYAFHQSQIEVIGTDTRQLAVYINMWMDKFEMFFGKWYSQDAQYLVLVNGIKQLLKLVTEFCCSNPLEIHRAKQTLLEQCMNFDKVQCSNEMYRGDLNWLTWFGEQLCILLDPEFKDYIQGTFEERANILKLESTRIIMRLSGQHVNPISNLFGNPQQVPNREAEARYFRNKQEAEAAAVVPSSLICPVCFEMSRNMVFCTNHHTVCIDCVPKLENCPLCRGLITAQENEAVKELFDLFNSKRSTLLYLK